MEEREFLYTVETKMMESGFFPVQDEHGGTIPHLYWRVENPVFYLVVVADAKGRDLAQWKEQVERAAEELKGNQEDFRCTRTVCLSLLAAEEKDDAQAAFVEKQQMSFEEDVQYIWWYVLLREGEILTGFQQPRKLLGLEKILYAAAKGENTPTPFFMKKDAVQKPFVTMGIFFICAVILLLMLLTGKRMDWILAYGSGWEEVVENKEYYRLLTSMFIHSGLIHLGANSIYLFYFGVPVERLLGHGKFLALYLISGLCGSLLSLFFSGALGVGASGAIFGLMGTALVWTKKRGASVTGMNYATMLLLVFSALGMGMLDTGVDNFAHLGGFLGGVAVFYGFLRRNGKKSTENKEKDGV